MATNKVVLELAAKDTSGTAFANVRKNMSAAEAQTKKLEDATQRLVQEITLEGLAVGKTADEIKLLKLAQQGATREQLNAAKAAMTNRDELIKTGKQSGAFNGQMRLMRGGLGQVGHQVQDVAVQLQMGQNAMLVFGQQGSQVASLFGQRGAIIGAFLAVGAAIATYLMPNMQKLSNVMKDLKSDGDALIDNFDDLSGSLRVLAAKKAEDEIASLQMAINEATEEQAEAQKKLNHQAKEAKLGVVAYTPIVKKLNDTVKEQGDIILLANKRISDLKKKTDGVTDSTEDLIEELKEELATVNLSGTALAIYMANKAKATGANKDLIISLYQQIEAEEYLKQSTEDARKAELKAAEDLEKSYKKVFDSIGDGFVDAITGSKNFSDAMRDMAKSVIDSLIKMLIQKYIVDAAFGAITGVISGGLGQAATNVQGGYSASMGDPFSGNFAGGGYTGNGSRSGGLDGKGGFAAILHPRETVVDHHQGQSMGGGVTVNQTINVTTGVQQTVRAEIATLMPQIASAAKNAVADARMRGGNYSKMLVGA